MARGDRAAAGRGAKAPGGKATGAKPPRKERRAAARDRRRNRFTQVKQVWQMTRAADRRLPVKVALGALVGAGVAVGVALLLGLLFSALGLSLPVFFLVPVALFGAVLGGLITFGRRAQRGMFEQLRGQPGGALPVLQQMKKWSTHPEPVEGTRRGDLVWRTLSRAGVVLVTEGEPKAVGHLVAKERKRLNRLLGPDVPVHHVAVGEGEDEVPVDQLQKRLRKLPTLLKPPQVTEVDRRLASVARRPPLPGGPVPQGGMPRGARRMMRGR